ncbi:MAG: hypothetical protein C5B58_06995 [Acidobacteria bacterium]|nr:MAG: hypothetical protein C5B58_06995 [Acidobacteriota bacterium]
MTRDEFFEKFKLFADTPDAVDKMRELVLRLAASGKLTEQDPTDQPASELVGEIFAIRNDLMRRGLVRSRTEGSPIAAGDTLEIPPSWTRCKISEVCDLQTGATPSRQEPSYFGGNIPWLVSGDVNKGEITECEGRITDAGVGNSNCKIIPSNSVLIALNGQGKTRGTVAILRVPAALNQSLVAMIPYSRERLLPEYIFWNLRGRYYAIRDVTGQDQRRGLNMKLVGQLSLPIPPIAEQKRIVAKVVELMRLCDRLEGQQLDLESRRAALAHASLVRFAEAPNPTNLEFILHKSYAVAPADLRKTILTLAVQGKLVAQDPNDEPAATLLSEIELEKSRRLKEGTLRNLREPLPIEDEEKDFELPANWEWVRMGQVVKLWSGFAFKSSDYQSEGVPVIRIGDLQRGIVDLTSAVCVSEDVANSVAPEIWIPEDALLLAMSGATTGKVAVNRTGRFLLLNQRVGRIQPILLNQDFLQIFFETIVARNLSISFGSAIPNLSAEQVNGTILPLPPLTEQRRIVLKVNELMSLVEALETELSKSHVIATNLNDAMVTELTAAA